MKTDEAFFTVKVKPGRIKIVYSKKGVKKISFPEKNKITFIELINNIFAYSPKENNANPIAEYSTL